LHYAAFWGLHSIVHFLVIEHSQDVRSRSVTDDATPLHLASKYGHKQVACFLLERGADVSAEDKYGNTPLHLVSQAGHVEVAHMLIERGADVSAQDKDGSTPLHLALQGDMWKSLTCLSSAAQMFQPRTRAGRLHYIWRADGQVEVAHMLIERGADVSAQGSYGNTPLHLALRWGRVEVAHMLIERGADVSAQDAGREDSITSGVAWGTCGSRSHAYRAWRRCFSPTGHYIWRGHVLHAYRAQRRCFSPGQIRE
jgi:ankyrin